MLSHISARTRGQGRGPPTPEGQIWAWHTHRIRILGDELVTWPRGCSKGSRCRVSSSVSTKAGRRTDGGTKVRLTHTYFTSSLNPHSNATACSQSQVFVFSGTKNFF